MRRVAFAATVVCIMAGMTPRAWSGQGPAAPLPQEPGTLTESQFRYPTFDLRGQLRETFSLGRCEYISGMTCKIRYTGAHPLPSRVFFVEFDKNGHQAGPELRLLYPRLGRGETGSATFRIRLVSPARVKLRGEWKGPWQDPY